MNREQSNERSWKYYKRIYPYVMKESERIYGLIQHNKQGNDSGNATHNADYNRKVNNSLFQKLSQIASAIKQYFSFFRDTNTMSANGNHSIAFKKGKNIAQPVRLLIFIKKIIRKIISRFEKS